MAHTHIMLVDGKGEKMKRLFDREITDEQFNFLMCEQAKGKQIKVVENEIIAVEVIPTQREISQQEINKLKHWFNTEYLYKEQKFRRLIALNKLDDDGIDAKTKLTELYIQAELKRIKIQELENEV